MKKDRSWNSAGDRRFVRGFKEHWVDVAGGVLFGAFVVGVAMMMVG